MRVDIPVRLQLLFGTSLLCCCTSSLVTEVYDDSEKVGAGVVPLRCCPQSCMPNPIEGLLEVYEDMVEVLLVLEIFLTEVSLVEDLLRGASSCSEAYLFLSNDLLRLWLQSDQNDLQHDFAWVADEADRSVVLAMLQVAFLLRPKTGSIHVAGHSPACQILLQIVVKAVITSSPPAWTSSSGMERDGLRQVVLCPRLTM